MNPEIELLDEVWSTVKEHVNRKDQLAVAETIVRQFDEALNLDVGEMRAAAHDYDAVLRAAVISYYEIEDDEDEW